MGEKMVEIFPNFRVQKIHPLITGWWFQPICKNISQKGSFRQLGVNIRKICETTTSDSNEFDRSRRPWFFFVWWRGKVHLKWWALLEMRLSHRYRYSSCRLERICLSHKEQLKKQKRPLLTLPESNIATENVWLVDYFPFGKAYFQGLC